MPFYPRDLPSIRYAYRHRLTVLPEDAFKWPASVPVGQRQLTPAQVRRRYIDPAVEQTDLILTLVDPRKVAPVYISRNKKSHALRRVPAASTSTSKK